MTSASSTWGDGHGSLLILGLGNVLCGDDGLGVVAAALLAREYELPAGVKVIDGGTLGLALLHYVSEADKVLLVDAVRTGDAPGTLVRLAGDEVAPAARERLSVHQVGVADLLDALRLLDAYPKELRLVGLVPATLDLRLGRSPEVAARMSERVAAVADEAGRLGFPLRRKSTGRNRPAARGTRDDEKLDGRHVLAPAVVGSL